MAFSSRKSRIPALSMSCKSAKPSYHHQSGFDSLLSCATASKNESHYRYGVFSTQKKAHTSFKPNKYTNCHSASTYKGAKGLFHQSPKTDRQTSHYPSSAAASSRRSSIMGDRSRQKDSRQLSDPKYQNACITKLIQFLTQNGYPSPIPTKFLKSPSKQDVIKVFEFLFGQLESNIEIMPIETRVPELMAEFGYPYYIPKSSLISFSGRQAIGNLLGMFEFLVDNAMYMQNLDVMELVNPKINSDDSAIKTSLLAICLDQETDSDMALKNLATEKYGNEAQLSEIENQEEELISNIQQLDEEIEALSSIPKRILEYEDSLRQFRQYNEYMEEKIASDEQEIIQLKEDIKALEEQLALNNEKVATIEQKVIDQPHSVEELKIAREKQYQIEKEINEDKKAIKQLRLAIQAILNEKEATEALIIKVLSDFSADLKSKLMNINTGDTKNYIPWVVDTLTSSDLISILDQLISSNSLTKSKELEKRLTEIMKEKNKYLVEVNVDLSAKLVKLQQRGKQLTINEAERKKEMETVLEELAKDEQDLQEYKQQCSVETKLANEKFSQLRKELEEKEQALKEFFQTNADRIAQLQQEVSQQSTKNKETKEQQESKVAERREKVNKQFETIEKSLTKVLELEKLSVEEERTQVEAWRSVHVRLQRKVEETRNNLKSTAKEIKEINV